MFLHVTPSCATDKLNEISESWTNHVARELISNEQTPLLGLLPRAMLIRTDLTQLIFSTVLATKSRRRIQYTQSLIGSEVGQYSVIATQTVST